MPYKIETASITTFKASFKEAGVPYAKMRVLLKEKGVRGNGWTDIFVRYRERAATLKGSDRLQEFLEIPDSIAAPPKPRPTVQPETEPDNPKPPSKPRQPKLPTEAAVAGCLATIGKLPGIVDARYDESGAFTLFWVYRWALDTRIGPLSDIWAVNRAIAINTAKAKAEAHEKAAKVLRNSPINLYDQDVLRISLLAEYMLTHKKWRSDIKVIRNEFGEGYLLSVAFCVPKTRMGQFYQLPIGGEHELPYIWEMQQALDQLEAEALVESCERVRLPAPAL